MEQSFAKMNKKKLAKLVETIITLKEVLKCPICLDVMRDIVELECSHKYCKGCYLKHKSTQKHISCPLCKRILKRRCTTYIDNYADTLGTFVYNCCENLRNVFKCEVELLRDKLALGIELSPKKSDVLQQNVTSQNNNFLAIPSTSKDTNKVTKQSEQSKRKYGTTNAGKKRAKQTESSYQNCENAFDNLVKAQLPISFNKKGTRHVYANKKKLDEKPELDYDILEFDNYENKAAVLRWLNDTRNKFDRLTQTQNITEEVCDVPVINLVSVSQVKGDETFKPTASKIWKGRAKSLDVEIKKLTSGKTKRHSHGGSVSLENYNIEDVNTEEEEVVKKAEEKVILDLIEDEFLDTLENEMQNTKDTEFDVKSKRNKGCKKKSKPLSPTSTTGWNRLTKIKKTIKKSERIPKKLNITLQSTQETKSHTKSTINQKMDTLETTNSDKQNRDLIPDIIINEQIDGVTKKSGNIPKQINITLQSTEMKSKNKTNITSEFWNNEGDTVETTNIDDQNNDFGQRFVSIENKNADINTSNKPSKQLNVTAECTEQPKRAIRNTKKSCNEKTDCLETTNIDNQNGDLDQGIIRNEKVDIENKSRPPEDEVVIRNITEQRQDDSRVPTNRDQKQSYDLETVEDYIAKNIKIIDKNTSVDTTLLHTTQHSKHADIQIHEQLVEMQPQTATANVIDENCKQSNDDSCVLLDVLFNTPTQKILPNNDLKSKEGEIIIISDTLPEQQTLHGKSPIKNIRRSIECKQDASVEDEITSLYDCPTQKLNNICKDVDKIDTVIEKHSSVEGLLDLSESCLEKCIINLKSVDVVVENQLRNLQLYLSKLKSVHKNENIGVKEKPVPRKLCNAETQVFMDVTNKIIQTEDDRNNIGVQTEGLYCIKCNPDLNKSKVRDNAKLLSQNTKTMLESMMDETNVDFKPTLHSTVVNKNNTSLKPVSQNEIFTCTLDNLNFETQELTKNQGTITKNPPMIELSQIRETNIVTKEVNGIDKNSEENIPGSILMCSLNSNKSLTSKKVNRKLTYNADKTTKLKRIRQPMSGSDSENESPAKRKCNRFLRDDLTVEFLTHPEKDLHRNTASESQDSDDINYDEYLAEVLKKYDGNNFSTNTCSSSKKANVLTPKQETIRKCEEMIANANKNLNKIKPITELSACSSKDSFKTASADSVCNNLDDVDKVFMDQSNLLKLESDIREYEKESVKCQNSEISDIIGESEEIEPLPKRRKKIVQKNDLQLNKPICESKNEDKLLKNQALDETCGALNDSISEAEVEKLIAISEAQMNLNSDIKVKIISNVKIKSQDAKGLVPEEEDDIFSDEDIVETTPQKRVDSFAERSAQSQILTSLSLIGNVLPTPVTEIENFDFDTVPLPPPPDFQDNIADSDILSIPDVIEIDDNPMEDSTTITNFNKSSLTPDHLSQHMFHINRSSKKSQVAPCILQVTRENEGRNLTAINSCNNNSIAKDELERDENKLSLTPDKFIEEDSRPAQRNMPHSTQIEDIELIRESLGFSPIPARKSQKMGMAEMAEAARYTPLNTITKPTPQKRNLFSSTPRQTSILNYVKSSQSDDEAPVVKRKPRIACSRLSKDKIKYISQLTNKKLATYNSQFDSSVTHMIVGVNEENCVKDYTIKFVSAVAAGIWVLRFDWIEECLSKNCIVPEEPFEVLDISGLPGPKTSRLTRIQNPLFKGYKFFCAEPIISTTQEEIEEILKMLGGKVLSDLRGLLEDDGNIRIIIAEGHATQDFEQYERWVEQYKTVTVDLEWLSKCVGQYKILSVRPFIWCSEDNLGDLGYPSILTETVPFSFTETL